MSLAQIEFKQQVSPNTALKNYAMFCQDAVLAVNKGTRLGGNVMMLGRKCKTVRQLVFRSRAFIFVTENIRNSRFAEGRAGGRDLNWLGWKCWRVMRTVFRWTLVISVFIDPKNICSVNMIFSTPPRPMTKPYGFLRYFLRCLPW